MRPFTKRVIVACAVVVAFLCVRDATAGNLSAPSAEYFSVELTLGQYVSHSDSNATILVDDVTYSCEWSPCDPTEECRFFSAQDYPHMFEGPDPPPPPPDPPVGFFLRPGGSVPPGLRPIPGAPPPPPTATNFYYTPYTLIDLEWGWKHIRAARGVFGAVLLRDTDGSLPGHIVDRFSVDAHGELGEIHEVDAFGAEPTEFEHYHIGYEDTGVGVGGASGLGIGRDVVTQATTVSWPASGSRHYQSPHVVRLGRVYFEDAGSGTMHAAVACVKGRVILPPNPPPIVSTGLAVSGP